MITFSDALKLTATLRDNGGFTVDAVTGNPIRFEGGYLVGGVVPERIADALTYREMASEIMAFVEANAVDLADPFHFLGAWVDTTTGYVHLDVAEWVAQFGTAIRMGTLRGEKAVWSLADKAEVRL